MSRIALTFTGTIQRYAFAVSMTACGFALTLVISRAIHHPIFQIAVVAVVFSAWYGGFGPSLLSAALSATLIAVCLLEPIGSLQVDRWEEILQIGVFLVVAVVVSALSEARHRAERSLQARTKQLEDANRELDAFSYSVSHDLRRPLRAIDGYSSIVLADYSAQLGPEAQRYLNLVRGRVQYLGQLVDDLLAFSRLGRQALNTRALSPADVVKDALNELKPEQDRRGVDVRIHDLPGCEADGSLLRQVYVNLLDNALKFTRGREAPVIEVGARQTRNRTVYYVRDNGIGFDMAYAEHVFGVFQRLDVQEAYEGTGVGLAIVRRIVEKHGGEIWAEAERDRGATVYLTLSRKPSTHV
jgi:light-regulated signal transduction histidine kinase (bacteriophytochrome)